MAQHLCDWANCEEPTGPHFSIVVTIKRLSGSERIYFCCYEHAALRMDALDKRAKMQVLQRAATP